MDTYIYAGDMYCAECAERLRADRPESDDSDDYPQGPYPDGGGESDCPQHCGSGRECANAVEVDGNLIGEFLENPLTECGRAYVLAARPGPVADMWREFYGLETPESDD